MCLSRVSWLVNLLLLVWISEATVFIQPNHPACKQQGSQLVCDFKDSSENIELRDLDSSLVTFKFGTVLIQNANSLVISRQICYDLNLKNNDMIKFVNDLGCGKKAYRLTISDSKVDKIPRKLSSLTILNSHVDVINLDLGLQRLYLSRMSVGMFNIPWPIGGSPHLSIEYTHIQQFKKINLEQRVVLNILNSTVGVMESEAISLGSGASLVVTGSTIEESSSKASVVLKPGSKFTIKNLKGILLVASSVPGKEDIEGKRPPGVPVHKPIIPDEETVPVERLDINDCTCASVIWWIIPTVVALGEALFILYVFRTDKRPQLFKNVSRRDSESGYDNFNVKVQGSQDGYNSYYNAAPPFPNTALTRRR